VVTWDHRGFGGSDVGFASYTAEDTGRDVAQFIDQQRLARVVVAGCSMAGASALWVAAERPAAVLGVVLLDPFVRDIPMPFGVASLVNGLLNRCTGPWFWATYYASLYTLPQPPRRSGVPAPVPDLEQHVARLRAHLGEPGRLDTLYHQLNSSKASCEARIVELAARRVPALGVWGSRDPDFPSPAAEAELVTARLNGSAAASSGADSTAHAAPSAHARHVLIEGAGHYPHVEAASAVAEAILAFSAQFA
jgi:pimeloyl-ACP methyl ester carboxylesterase